MHLVEVQDFRFIWLSCFTGFQIVIHCSLLGEMMRGACFHRVISPRERTRGRSAFIRVMRERGMPMMGNNLKVTWGSHYDRIRWWVCWKLQAMKYGQFHPILIITGNHINQGLWFIIGNSHILKNSYYSYLKCDFYGTLCCYSLFYGGRCSLIFQSSVSPHGFDFCLYPLSQSVSVLLKAVQAVACEKDAGRD